jgi:signal transduction histidine kinase
MDRRLIKKIILFIVISLLVRISLVYAHNLINLNVTDYVEVKDQSIEADALTGSLVKVLPLERNPDGVYTFIVESPQKNAIMFIHEDGHTEYKIYVNNQLRRQNIDEALFGYTNEIVYGVFDIGPEDYRLVDGGFSAEVHFHSTNYNNASPIFLVGTKEAVRKFLSLRTVYNALMLMCFIIILLISSFFYYKDKTTYILITLLISIVSVFKCIVSGELPVLSNLFGISTQNYFFYDGLTNVVNYFLYQILLYKLYQIKIKRFYIFLYAGLSLLLTGDYLLRGNMYSFLLLYFVGSLIIFSFQLWGYIKDKPYSMIIFTTYSIFGGFNLYRILIGLGYLKQGYISSIIYGPQIGSIVYILGFLIAVIMTYFKKLEEYEKNQEEYARVALLRGIGHDLKLPLSVIKMNNQMLEKYRMSYEEQKLYTGNSIEATQELENMANKINSYLSIDRVVEVNKTTSLKKCFEKLEKHYCTYESKGCIFKVLHDKRDYTLNIEPIQFDRMLYNLVDNAFKYNKKNGEVCVEYRIRETEVIIEVADTGIGMKKEYIDKIFDPFYRIEKSRTEEGLGLGLSVVKGILNSVKGKIKVESTEDVGTKIIIAIPKSI